VFPRRHFSSLVSLALPAVILLALLNAPAGPALRRQARAAAEFDVNSTLDAVDDNPGDGMCHTVGGHCTLRAAIMEANHTAGGGATINVPAGTYVLTLVSGGTDDETVGDLDITADMTIVGAGAESTIVDGNGDVMNDRVFEVGAVTAAMSGLTVQHGRFLSTPGSYQGGGGIYNAGTLTLNSARVNENQIVDAGQGAYGGGIFNDDGTLTLADCTINDNRAEAGGGIWNEAGDVTLTNCTLNGNEGVGGGGGIYQWSDGLLSVTDSVIEENTANFGGGIYSNVGTVDVTGSGIFNYIGSVGLENSTVAGNHANIAGGLANGAGTVYLTNSAVNNNTAEKDGGGIYDAIGLLTSLTNSTVNGNHAGGMGGGVVNDSGLVVISDSTVSGNDSKWGGGIAYGSPVTATNSTISGNMADEDGGGFYGLVNAAHLYNVTTTGNYADYDLNGSGVGGGVFIGEMYDDDAEFYFENSLIALNYESEPDGGGWARVVGDCAGTLQSNGYNLMTAYSAECMVTGGVTLADPMLGPLAYYGGPTQTHALLPGSPAIDAGDPSGCLDSEGVLLATDQRGLFRHAGGRCDLGAYEFHMYTSYFPLTVY
jgi:CSLREA domain-containing protein